MPGHATLSVVILVDAGQHPRVVATIAAGSIVYLAEADRLLG